MPPKRDIANPMTDVEKTPQRTSDAIFGQIRAADATAGERVRPISIFEIYPDPMQPRRAMPSAVRQQWDGQLPNIGQAFTVWSNMAKAELRQMGVHADFELSAFILSKDDPVSFQLPEFGAPLSVALRDLIGLASLIYRNGLVNPITVIRESEYYSIETGERRWMAYHLLRWMLPDDSRWQNIPARLMDVFDVWRQASENNARQNLNAISKARQFALLMMELIGWDSFQHASQFTSDQAFYAQVTEYRVPSGKSELLMSAMGFKSRQSINRCQKLLRLPADWWIRGDDENTPEDTLLRFVPDKNVTTRDNSHIEKRGKAYTAADLKPYQFVLEIDERATEWEPSLKKKALEEIEIVEKRIAYAKSLLGE